MDFKNLKDLLKRKPTDAKDAKEELEHVSLKPVPKGSKTIDKSIDPKAFREMKWNRIFTRFFDTNQNKVIDWNDFELLAEKIKDLRGEDSAEFKIVSEVWRTIWKGLVHDIKGMDIKDSSDLEVEISMEEWTRMWEKFNPNHPPNWQREYLKYMFLLIDTCGDKLIDKNEYCEVMGLFGADASATAEAFDSFALDESGNPIAGVDFGKFVKLWNEYFTSGDLDRPANFLFGLW